MAKVLELQFVTQHGKSTKLTVDNPVEPIGPAAVKAAMENIIASNAFQSTSGDLVAIEGARVVEHNVTDFEII